MGFMFYIRFLCRTSYDSYRKAREERKDLMGVLRDLTCTCMQVQVLGTSRFIFLFVR